MSLFFLTFAKSSLGATDDVCNISYAMVEEAIQVLFSIYYNKKLTVHRFMENFENLVD
jgi:hypothetical protein